MTWQHRAEPGVPPYSLEFASLGSSQPVLYRRADTDDNGVVNLTDAVFGLSALFLGNTPQPTCLDAADSDDNGFFNLTDAIYTLQALFMGGTYPPAPGMEQCGSDPTNDALDCDQYDSC
jgi:hypothetical protein